MHGKFYCSKCKCNHFEFELTLLKSSVCSFNKVVTKLTSELASLKTRPDNASNAIPSSSMNLDSVLDTLKTESKNEPPVTYVKNVSWPEFLWMEA